MTNAVILKPGAGQNIAVHALPTARNILLVLIFAFLIRLPSVFFVVVVFKEKKKRSKKSSPNPPSMF